MKIGKILPTLLLLFSTSSFNSFGMEQDLPCFGCDWRPKIDRRGAKKIFPACKLDWYLCNRCMSTFNKLKFKNASKDLLHWRYGCMFCNFDQKNLSNKKKIINIFNSNLPDAIKGLVFKIARLHEPEISNKLYKANPVYFTYLMDNYSKFGKSDVDDDSVGQYFDKEHSLEGECVICAETHLLNCFSPCNQELHKDKFCKSCLGKIIDKNPICPLCRGSIVQRVLPRDFKFD